jgi:uncharacterized coiled-coil DUF342 family protein
MSERETSQGQMEATLQKWGVKLDEMKAKVDHVSDEAKVELQQKIKTLTGKKEALQEKLSELKSSSDDAWKSLKEGMQSAWDELSSAFEEAASKFKN